VRKNIYITPENENRIQHTRALFLDSLDGKPIDVQYTSVVNMFVELGQRVFYTDFSGREVNMSSREVRSIVAKYVYNKELTEKGLNDQVMDIMNRRLWKEWRETKQLEAKGV
jgi:hypothetical protein